MLRSCSAAAVALACCCALSPAQAVRPPAKPVAVVNGVAISPGELDAVVRAAGPVPVHLPSAQRRQRQVEALGLLVDVVLMRQHLEKNTPPVPPTEIARRLAEVETGLKAEGKSVAEFCHDTNQTEEQFKAGVVDHIRWSAFVAAKIADADVAKYHADNRDFFDKVTVEASHIVYRLSPAATAKEKDEAKASLAAVRKQIVEGKADFAEMAKKHSQDPRAAQGGELGTFPRRWVFDEPFCKAAFALEAGQVSEVVETEFGYHLIKVTKRNAGTPSELAKIKEVVREFAAEDMRQTILAELRKAGKIEIDLP